MLATTVMLSLLGMVCVCVCQRVRLCVYFCACVLESVNVMLGMVCVCVSE